MKKSIECYFAIIVIIAVTILTGCKKEKVPVITTTAVSNITATTATSGGNITDEGSSTVISRGVCWGTGTSPTITDSKTTDGAGAGSFSSNLTSLNGVTVYYVRAYATNSVGTGYGMAMSFTTLGQTPSLTVAAAANINVTSATLNGSVNANYLSTVVTFEYGTTASYGSTVTATQSPVTGNTSTNVSADITGLTSGTTYHYRIKAVNSLGTTYSNDITFTTLGQVPTVTTLAATNINSTSATLNGSVNANYLSTVVTFEYGTTTSYGSTATVTQSPVTGNAITNVSANITGLTVGMTYHFRVKAINSLGTTYGSDLTFTYYTVTDVEGNIYITVPIGTQVWMKENLKTTKYNDGTAIPLVTDGTAWGALTSPAYCWYNNDAPTNKDTYGALYNWYSVNTGKLCPSGWHVSTDSDWKTLEMYLGMTQVQVDATGWRGTNQGTQLKSTTGWVAGVADNGTDIVGFSGLPAGVRELDGSFGPSVGNTTNWWSSIEYNSTSAWCRYLNNASNSISRFTVNKVFGFSVRCLKD
jgi:uncharacterized protein (TIGR02145 family)